MEVLPNYVASVVLFLHPSIAAAIKWNVAQRVMSPFAVQFKEVANSMSETFILRYFSGGNAEFLSCHSALCSKIAFNYASFTSHSVKKS